MRPGRRILHLALGGTIACVHTRRGLRPALSACDLLDAIRAPAGVAVEGVDLLRRTIVFPRDWLALAREVVRRQPDCDAFVVTLGTDTLAYAAAALEFLLAGVTRPVVLTGAMRPPGERASDGPRNLRDALRVAAAPGLAGVLVVFGGDIFGGGDVTKLRSEGLRAFAAVRGPPLGAVRRGKIRWRRRPEAPRAPRAPRDRLDTRVAVCKLAPQTDSRALRSLSEARGVLLEGYGDGNVPSELVAPLAALARRRLVVLASQCALGAVQHRYEGGRALIRAGALSAGTTTKEGALVRLMWALGAGRDRVEAGRLFLEAARARG